MSELFFGLHEKQQLIFDDPARFKVVAAGRRFGKSHLACVTLILAALQDTAQNGYDLSNEEVYYIAPTFDQAKRIMWPLLKMLAKMECDGGVIKSLHENTAVATLVNGRRISIKGADRPDTLRGVGLSYAILDEYADMKSEVWEMIIQPCLARSEGGALFIGTPKGKNHFFDIFEKARTKPPGYEDWQAFQFESTANPTLSKKELARSIATMSVAAARQEYGASFNSGGGEYLREAWWKYGKRPSIGSYYITVDLAGFSESGGLKRGALKVRDEHAICIAKCSEDGWWVEEILTGQWDVRKTALMIVKAYSDYRPVKIGIEKGALKNAVGPYLDDEMKRLNRYFLVHELTHGGNAKPDRIRWALQGRLEKGRLILSDEESFREESLGWQRKLIEQASDFPSPLAHDDMIDALAYVDQLADVAYQECGELDTHDVFDLVSGM